MESDQSDVRPMRLGASKVRFRRGSAALAIVAFFTTACSGGGSTSEPSVATTAVVDNEGTSPPTAASTVASTSTVAPTTTPTTVPPELSIDQTGNDLAQIYRDLDAARDYLYRNPEAADPSDFVGPHAGGGHIAWLADRGYRVETVDGTHSIDAVDLHGQVSDDRVHLYVTDTSTRTTRTLNANDEIVSTGGGRSADSQTARLVVTLEQGPEGRWRIMADDAVSTPENDDGTYAPVRISDEIVGEFVSSGTVDTADDGPLDWEIHSYVDGNFEGACLDFYVGERSRFVRCIPLVEQERLVREGNIRLVAIGSDEFDIELRLTLGVRAGVEVVASRRDGPVTFIRGNPIQQDLEIGGVVAGEHWELIIYRIDGQEFGRDEQFNTHDCGEWALHLPIEETALSEWAAGGDSRAATRDELTDGILAEIDDYYFVPEIDVLDGSAPPDFDPVVYPNLPDNPDLFNVTASNWGWQAQGRAVTWSLALAEDPVGWHVITAAFRMDCDPGVETS